VAGGERDHELLAQEVAPLEAGGLLAGEGAVLEGEREVQLAGADARREVLAAFVDGDLGVGVAVVETRDGGWDEPGERGREGADPQPGALGVGGDGELLAGELEALGDGVGVLEQDLALPGESQAAGLAVEQPGADLVLQRRDLVGDRWLGERELAGGA